MRVLDRYIVFEQLKIFWLAVILLLITLLLDKARFLADLLLARHSSALDIGKMLIYLSPSFLVLAAPLAVMMSTILLFSRLTADNEITAMKASGVSLFRMVLPVAFVSVGACVVTLYISTNLEHVGNLKFRNAGVELLKTNLSLELKERRFNTGFDDLVMYVNKNDDGNLSGIFISDKRGDKKAKIIEARNGRFLLGEEDGNNGGGSILLSNGVIHSLASEGRYQTIAFSSYSLKLDFQDANSSPLEKELPHMSLPELSEKIVELESSGKSANAEIVAYHKKFSAPVGCIVLGLLGVPLGVVTRGRGSGGGGFGLGVLMIVVNYILWMLAQGLGVQGRIPPEIAIWAPNLLMSFLAIYLLFTASADKVPGWELSALIEKLRVSKV